MTVSSSVPPTTDTAKQPTSYVVLVNDATGRWVEHETAIPAANADAAIRKIAAENPGVYVAVPARSWKPRTVTVETKPRVRLT